MDSFFQNIKGLSLENHADDVYVKSRLTIELDKIVKQLVRENKVEKEKRNSNEKKCLLETPNVIFFCDIIEAIFLHGLKEKFSTAVSNVFNSKSRQSTMLIMDFWPVIVVLCHSEESKYLKRLQNVSTDIGRCRAWIRMIMNQGLLRSYFESLTSDTSLLNCFYRSTAYLRDSQHREIMRKLICELDHFIFSLSIDDSDLNSWKINTLNYLGVSTINQTNTFLVVTAVDAIHLIDESKSNKKNENKNLPFYESSEITSMNVQQVETFSNNGMKIHDEINNEVFLEKPIQLNENQENSKSVYSGNSLTVKSSWSSNQQTILDESFNALLESYSTNTFLLNVQNTKNQIENINEYKQSESFEADIENFDIVTKNEEKENQDFIEQLSKLSKEWGLSQSNYKCWNCCRPIGLIYGKYEICHMDGHLYCLECHGNEEYVVPAQIIYNWNFKKFSMFKNNKVKLIEIENQPLFDLKLLSPNLYSSVPEMKEILDMRTQLFFLHSYLFTCQEDIALKMRKLVWPHEHLFEHIHLYSINNLQQINNNVLATMLKQVINFAQKHIFKCELCRLKGFYCEICKNSEILYPFDIKSTNRCENCKTVFHRKCYLEKYKKNDCPKCLRISKKKTFI